MFKPKGVMIFTLVFTLLSLSCSGPESDQPLLTAELPLHLEEHIDDARIEGSEVREDLLTPIEWRFDEPQPDWKPVNPLESSFKPVQVTFTDDALRITMSEANRRYRQIIRGGIYIDLPEWHREQWDSILVSARTKDNIRGLLLAFNLRKRLSTTPGEQAPYLLFSEGCRVVKDGLVHTYRLRVDRPDRKWDVPLEQLFIMVQAGEPANIDILSVKAVPKEALYSDSPVGLSTEVFSNAFRRTLFNHTPGKLEYRVKVPKAGRFDVGLGVLRGDIPVTFRITVIPKGREEESLLEEVYSDREHWAQRSVDLSNLAGQTVTLRLETDAERAGTVSLWAAPTLSGIRATKKPNIILYIIDGAGAEYMSVYGYNRRTTPNLERLATEGAVFENAYSNSRWTKPSTPSFMTSLHHSVLGGFTSLSDPLPEQVMPMAEHFHRAGYQTALFTGNSLAGRTSSLDRGIDVLRDVNLYGSLEPSSIALHKEFLQWRKVYTGQPYWVHFQTIDVHMFGHAQLSPPFAGLFLTPARRAEYLVWEQEVGRWPVLEQFKKVGVDRFEYYNRTQKLYSEAMAQQDHEIGKLVERLKTMGEWENTLLVVASDHGQHESGLVRLDTYPPNGQHTHLRSEHTRIPMIFVWPGHIEGGQRFTEPVSMIDMLPTLLDLAELPLPNVMQGQSLAPLLLGEKGWEYRPVILDEFYRDTKTGELRGWIEVVDDRWGASLAVNPHIEIVWREQPGGAGGRGEYGDAEGERPSPLLLYDLWNDPFCMTPLNDERPDLVEKYTNFLEARWEAHQALAQRFTRSKDSALTSKQLETLRSLGYIR